MGLTSALTRLRITTRLWLLGGLPLLGLAVVFITDSMQMKAQMVEARESRLRQVVEAASGVIEHFGEEARQGRLTEDQAKDLAKSAIRKMRYDKVEYLFINTLEKPHPLIIMHPISPALEGKYMDDAKFNRATSIRDGDAAKAEVLDHANLFDTLALAAERTGHGYVTYDWPKPIPGGGATTELYKKLSYVKRYQPWGWSLGSGIYIDDIEDAFRAELIKRGGWLALILAVVGGLGLLITRSVSSGFKALQHDIDAVQGGSPHLWLRADRADEFGKAAQVLAEMAENREKLARAEEERLANRRKGDLERHMMQRDMLRSLVQAAMLGNEAMITLSKMKYEIDLSTNEVNRMAVAIDEMSDSIHSISSDSTTAASGAGIAGSAANDGLGASQRALSAFERIVAAVSSAGAKVEGLATASAQIGEIVTAIEAVAGQTNLLALNATIEAARAGEAGKGFAVVANEVKGLANQTARATVDIRSRIEALQDEMGAIVGAIDESTTAVADGRTLVGNLGEQLHGIADQVNQVQHSMTTISSVLEGQSSTAGRLADGTNQMVTLARNNNQLLSDVLEAMGRMSSHLDGQVGTYAGLGSGALLVEIAKNDHVAFKRRVLDGVLGRIELTADGIPDHHACRLGKWYDAIEDQALRSNPAYTVLVSPHQEVHAAAKRALTASAKGDLATAFHEVDAMNQASVKVVEMLEALGGTLNTMEEQRLSAAI
jgi:methyl-accepting chemotaxis protein